MKKFLAVLLAVLTIFSCVGLVAYAEEGEEGTRYEICADEDFLTLYYVKTGNEKATILQPGDKVTTYKTTGKRNSGVDVLYYPDVDAVYTGEWVPADPNNIAFSLSGADFFRDDEAVYDGLEATIKGLDFTDFTIANSDTNTFVGWAVFDYQAASNQLKVCAVWDKTPEEEKEEDVDDLFFIVDFFYTMRKALFAPVFEKLRYLANAFLAKVMDIYTKIVGPKDVVA